MTIIWQKSTFSHDNSCVELAEADDRVLVRNSNHPDAGTLTLSADQMAAFIGGVKAGVIDDLA